MIRQRNCSYRFTDFVKHADRNGRILPNSIMRPAIEMVTGIPIGPCRGPLAPITEEERKILVDTMGSIGIKVNG